MKKAWTFVWTDHGTKTLGLVSGTLAAMAAIPHLIPDGRLPYIQGTVAVLVFWRGFINDATKGDTP